MRNKVSTIKSENKKAILFILPSLSGVFVFVIIPFFDAIRRSFFETMSGKFVFFKNFGIVLHNEAFKLAAKNTFKFLIICIPILLITSLFFSLLITSVKKFRDYFKTVFLLPMAIPVASVVLLWKIFFHEAGLFNVLIMKFGFSPIDWMNSEYSFWVLVFSYLWKNIGYDMILWIAGLNGISSSYYEAADIDGANAVDKFFYITLPNLKSTAFIILVLSLINSFKVFREAYLISGNYPHKSIYMLQHLFNNWFLALDIQKMCTGAVLITVIMLIIILFLQKAEEGEKD